MTVVGRFDQIVDKAQKRKMEAFFMSVVVYVAFVSTTYINALRTSPIEIYTNDPEKCTNARYMGIVSVYKVS